MLDDPHPLCSVISSVIALLAGPVDVVRTLPLSSTILLVNSSIIMFSTTPGLSIFLFFFPVQELRKNIGSKTEINDICVTSYVVGSSVVLCCWLSDLLSSCQ